jgi:hypothetical protein
MKQVIIENPIINNPFDEPTQHFRFSEEGITDQIEPGRRPSSFFVPIPKRKKQKIVRDTVIHSLEDSKNHDIGFTIPYTLKGDERNDLPDQER